MKKTIPLIVFAITLITAGIKHSYGFSLAKPLTDTSKYETVSQLYASEFIKLSSKQFSDITGKKMSIPDKISFIMLKRRMKHDLKNNPGLQLTDYYSSAKKTSTVKVILTGLLLLISIFLIVLAVSLKKH